MKTFTLPIEQFDEVMSGLSVPIVQESINEVRETDPVVKIRKTVSFHFVNKEDEKNYENSL